MASGPSPIQRKSGIALWRQIADCLRSDIASSRTDEVDRLPPEAVLADRFGVNRHTVRAAIRALALEGVLRTEQGRGTFIVRRRRLAYPIGPRTRFSAGLEGQAEAIKIVVLGTSEEPATSEIADVLEISAGRELVRLDILGIADRTPVSRSTAWFPSVPYGGIADHIESTGSITRALARVGVSDYLRRSTQVEARHADEEDTSVLKLSPGAILLIARAVNVLMDGTPLHYSITRFAADRVDLQFVHDRASEGRAA